MTFNFFFICVFVCSFLEKSREVKVDRTQATKFGESLEQIKKKLSSLETSVMQDPIERSNRDEPSAVLQRLIFLIMKMIF